MWCVGEGTVQVGSGRGHGLRSCEEDGEGEGEAKGESEREGRARTTVRVGGSAGWRRAAPTHRANLHVSAAHRHTGRCLPAVRTPKSSLSDEKVSNHTVCGRMMPN